VFGAAGAVEQHLGPVGGIEVFDGFEFQSLGFDGAAEPDEFVQRPKCFGISGAAPATVAVDGLVVAPASGFPVREIIDEVGDDVRGAGLAGEAEMLGVEHVAVESEAEFHGAGDDFPG